ncbi:MAG: histidine kinase [Bacteroidales bacterium]|nr:histidine kinase [Bacteroidales bacterium]
MEKLKKENIESQFEALKNEISPHFLFNSLNALQAIISENQVAAREFVYHLSSVLRYTLQSSDNIFVNLQEELQLANIYLFTGVTIWQ